MKSSLKQFLNIFLMLAAVVFLLFPKGAFSQTGNGFEQKSIAISYGPSTITAGMDVEYTLQKAGNSFRTVTIQGGVWSSGERVYVLGGDKIFSWLKIHGLIGQFKNLPQTGVRVDITPVKALEIWVWPFWSWGEIDGSRSGMHFLWGGIIAFLKPENMKFFGLDIFSPTLIGSIQKGQELPEVTKTGVVRLDYNLDGSVTIFGSAEYNFTAEEPMYRMGFGRALD